MLGNLREMGREHIKLKNKKGKIKGIFKLINYFKFIFFYIKTNLFENK